MVYIWSARTQMFVTSCANYEIKNVQSADRGNKKKQGGMEKKKQNSDEREYRFIHKKTKKKSTNAGGFIELN